MTSLNFNKEKAKSIITVISIITIIFVCLFLIFVILFSVQKSDKEKYENSLNYIYTKSFYDVVDNINNIDVRLNKLEVSNSTLYQQKLLTEISQNATFAQSSLSALPFSQNNLTKTLDFINKISGYTETVSKSLIDEQYSLTESQQQTLSSLKVAIEDVKAEFDTLTKEINSGKSIVANSKLNSDDDNNFSKDFENITKPVVDYPSMTYDGPFSDSVLNREIKGLTGEEITPDEAKEITKSIFTQAVSIAYTGETTGTFITYNFMVIYTNAEYYVQITKKGGHLLTMSSGNGSASKQINTEQATEVAENFLTELGYTNMKVNWVEENENFAYLNLAPVIDNVIYYPDLIKVKVSLERGTVEGLDATTYYYNHIERTLPTVTVSSTEATAKLSDLLTLSVERLALIPKEYLEEVLCYELICTYNNTTYYVYINASTGVEEQILKEVETDAGKLLV